MEEDARFRPALRIPDGYTRLSRGHVTDAEPIRGYCPMRPLQLRPPFSRISRTHLQSPLQSVFAFCRLKILSTRVGGGMSFRASRYSPGVIVSCNGDNTQAHKKMMTLRRRLSIGVRQ